MATIITDAASAFTVVVQKDGSPVSLSGSVFALLTTLQGETLIDAFALSSAAPGANWLAGVAAITFTAGQTAGLPAGEAMLSVYGDTFGVKRFQVSIESRAAIARSALFVKDIAVDRLRADTLVMAARGSLPKVPVSDDYLWDKLRAAESEMAHELRVPLVPTHFFPAEPTPAEIAALDGAPWAIDPGYDYAPTDFAYNDKWGMIRLRNKPLHSVSRVRFAYPGGPTAHYDLPLDWVRPDKKYGVIQFVPSSTAFVAPLNAFVMQAIGQGRTIPLAIQVSYVAGLGDVKANYPELLDAILKKAAIKMVEDLFLPQSGSISADGLSQSVSNDMAKHHETIDRILNGGKGSNGGLMTAIHGVRLTSIGG